MPVNAAPGATEPPAQQQPQRASATQLTLLPKHKSSTPHQSAPAFSSLTKPLPPLSIPAKAPPLSTDLTAGVAPSAAAAPAAGPVATPNNAQEPASIAGLASPVTAAVADPGPAGASAAAAVKQTIPAPITQTQSHPRSSHAAGVPAVANLPAAAAPATSQVAAAVAPPPLLRTSAEPAGAEAGTPVLPGAVPGTPTTEPQLRSQGPPASAQQQQPAGAAAGARARAASREPPKEPPPPAAVEHVSLTADGRTVEQYIPFGFVELRGKLLSDFPQIFADPGAARKFMDLSKWISLRNSLRVQLDYGDADEKYAPLDPDKDTLAFKVEEAAAAAAADTGGGGGSGTGANSPAAVAREPSRSLVPKTDHKAMVTDLYGELDRIFDKAEFTEMPPEDLENAKNQKSLMGLEVIPVPEDLLEYRLHYRGTRTKKIQFRRWGLIKRQIEMNVYERLAISFRLRRPVHKDDLPEDTGVGALGVDTRPWYRRMMCGGRRRVYASPALLELRDEFVYLKLFKDVLQSDVDMLLPGAVIRFTWFDHLMVWAPIIFGCAMAVWKAANGTIDFTNLVNAALSVVLIVMPLTWGVRAWLAVREKQQLHQAHLNSLFLFHSLNNNAGVIAQLLGEAQEQEDNESMLAYLFLWQGHAVPPPVIKLDLDRAVEAYLQRKLDELNVAIRMDYEVMDALTKLERMGLVKSIRGEDGVKRLLALPLDEALEMAHVRHFNEARETGQPDLPPSVVKRQGTIGLAWHECMDVFGPTGQKFRYFWNARTGESQYHEPDEPYIKLGAAAALDLENAYGANLADPQKQQPPLHHAKTA